jgi:hypothetical protein
LEGCVKVYYDISFDVIAFGEPNGTPFQACSHHAASRELAQDAKPNQVFRAGTVPGTTVRREFKD